jgi:L-asparagine transporter-like permease
MNVGMLKAAAIMFEASWLFVITCHTSHTRRTSKKTEYSFKQVYFWETHTVTPLIFLMCYPEARPQDRTAIYSSHMIEDSL